MKTGSRYVAFGTRSLSIATGLDHTTVAAHLRALENLTNIINHGPRYRHRVHCWLSHEPPATPQIALLHRRRVIRGKELAL